MKGKIVHFEPEDYIALQLLARDRMMTFQELSDEAFRDLIEKYGRPTGLREQLRKSAPSYVPARVKKKSRKA